MTWSVKVPQPKSPLRQVWYLWQGSNNYFRRIRENLVTSSNSREVWGIAVSSPIEGLGAKSPKVLAKMLFKFKKIVYSLILFGVRHKRIVTLTTFTDSLKMFCSFWTSFLCKILLTFSCQERKKRAQISRQLF